jgi:hypothetical protein
MAGPHPAKGSRAQKFVKLRKGFSHGLLTGLDIFFGPEIAPFLPELRANVDFRGLQQKLQPEDLLNENRCGLVEDLENPGKRTNHGLFPNVFVQDFRQACGDPRPVH